MTRVRIRNTALAVAAALALLVAPARAATLYDPALHSLPTAQGWITAGGGYSQGLEGGLYVLDTLAANAASAGSARTGLAALDTASGFELSVRLRLDSELHANDNRAGFSLIVTGLDPTHAIEIGFWGDRVFAYSSSFARGAQALWDTHRLTDYRLRVQQQHYSLWGGTTLLLDGNLVDYSARGGPYAVAGLIFFGDDTSSARSRSAMGLVSLSAIPEPGSWALMLGGLMGLGALRRPSWRRERDSNPRYG